MYCTVNYVHNLSSYLLEPVLAIMLFDDWESLRHVHPFSVLLVLRGRVCVRHAQLASNLQVFFFFLAE